MDHVQGRGEIQERESVKRPPQPPPQPASFSLRYKDRKVSFITRTGHSPRLLVADALWYLPARIELHLNSILNRGMTSACSNPMSEAKDKSQKIPWIEDASIPWTRYWP